MNEVQGAIAAAVVCAVAGYLAPLLVRRLPEPPEKPEEEQSAAERAEGPKETYAAIAALPWFAPTAMVVSGVAGGLVGWTLGWSWVLLVVVPVVPVAVLLSVVDLRTRLLPAVVVWPTFLYALAAVVLHGLLVATGHDLQRAAIALVVGYLFYFVLWFVHPSGLGFGDVRLSAVLALVLGYLGWPQFIVGMYAGFLLLGLPGLLLAVAKRRASYLKVQLPFGPFMAAGALLGIVLGPQLLGLAAR
ncbi:prepilin peptidase [Nocardioides litoris]|uniref:prepilin peptidase n=1 Tax=Nocardioides litoris TaxID=1926648 RepID=UPI0011245BC6|nr:A24 family peptidase [Nocardioides litoris]